MNSYMILMSLNPLSWVVILIVIFLLFGVGRLPKLARALGESKRALQDALSGSDADRQ